MNGVEAEMDPLEFHNGQRSLYYLQWRPTGDRCCAGGSDAAGAHLHILRLHDGTRARKC
jgi:hypothetical protein